MAMTFDFASVRLAVLSLPPNIDLIPRNRFVSIRNIRYEISNFSNGKANFRPFFRIF
jgi:hypothetical protein